MQPTLKNRKRGLKGFTLAELLISLAILGVIATFTVPMLLNAYNAQQNNAKIKNAVDIVSNAYQLYIKNLNGSSVPATTSFTSLFPFMQYARIPNEFPPSKWFRVDDWVGQDDSNKICGSAAPSSCIVLHSGAVVYSTWYCSYFNGTDPNHNVILFTIDPDGVYGSPGPGDGLSKSVGFLLYYNGRVTTIQNLIPPVSCGGMVSPTWNAPFSGADPSWFKW